MQELFLSLLDNLSSRLGVYKPSSRSYNAQNPIATRSLQEKEYELTDHLGNVRAVISDYRQGGGSDPIRAALRSYYNYYAFGMNMPGRNYFGTGQNRYGFNGKEKDTDFSNNYDYGFRIYNPNIAKFLSVDPLAKSYPWYTPYQFAGNTPIWAVDLDGLEEVIYTNNILNDKKFGKAHALMVSTDMGIKAIIDVWNTEKKSIKQDVYFVLVDNPSFFEGEHNGAFAITFSSKFLSDGQFRGTYRDEKNHVTNKMQFEKGKQSALMVALTQMDFSFTANKNWEDGNVSVIFVNKQSVDKLSTLEYSETLYHELKAHIVRNIELPANSWDRNGNKDHEEYHGTRGKYSPQMGQQKPDSLMDKFLKQARKSYYNPDNTDNIYKTESQKTESESSAPTNTQNSQSNNGG